MTLAELAACAAGRWTPGIGDPSAWGWITVLIYGGTAGACAVAASKSTVRRERVLWLLLALGLLGLAVNKQLDLQSGLTAAAWCHAQLAGWYEDRRGVQTAFIAGVAALAVGGATALGWSLRRRFAALWPVVLGACLVLAFVAIRAASFHKIDLAIGQGAFGITVNALFEVGGTLLIAWGAARAARAAGEAS